MRKRPQQQRSREMVRALIDATAQVIQQQGLDNTTTARIAEVAGVSVGSLYQYFGDKDGLIEEAKRHFEKLGKLRTRNGR